ncbi:MAG TPA: hypothetical protein V6D13_14595 [Halomicronema sp.]
MMSIYSFAFSTLLIIGSSLISQVGNTTPPDLSQQEENQQVLVAAAKNRKKTCPNNPQPKEIGHRGSGRFEPEQPNTPSTTTKNSQFQKHEIDLFVAEKNDKDKDQPGGDLRRAHRGSGRVEGEQDNTQKSSTLQIIAESESQDQNQEAHRGSGRLDA